MKHLEIGTKVYDIRLGWGEIVEIEDDKYPYKVDFKDYIVECTEWFTLNGSHNVNDFNATLSLTEYDLVNGGFTPLSDYNKPKVGDFGYFWDDNMVLEPRVIMSSITKVPNIANFYYDTSDEGYKHFSKEIPEFMKEKLNIK